VYCIVARCTIALGVAVTLLGVALGNASAQDTAQIARARYLVEGPAGCGDCHHQGACRVSPI
jgi:mono/diheme cytochrome c family protein